MSGYTILIVDDEAAQHEIIDEHLNLAGYQRLHATNGADALKIVEEKNPDLILMDIQMPVMDGFETLEIIRKKMKNTDTPVLFLSNLTRQHLKVKGLEMGADDYITKPFNSAELVARIRAALRRTDRFRRVEGKMDGNLADIGLSDLLQTMELGTKTAHIRLDEIKGEIFIQKGMFVHSRIGNFSGESALQRIFLLERGGFSIRFDHLPADIPIAPQPLTSVLMTTLAYVDEVREVVGRLRGEQTKITADASLSDFPTIEPFRAQFPIRIKELMILMDGGLKQNIKTIVKAMAEKQLKVV
jgi:DNA-binding response OmpR family regulator